MSDSYVCSSCGHAGSYGDFQSHNEDCAPDLFDTGMCPECEEFTDDLESWAG